MNLDSFKGHIKQLHPNTARQHPIFKDPISVIALGISAAINVLTLLLLLAKLHRVDYPVPVHYVSLIGFDQVGGWYQNYRLVAFSIAVMVINGLLAAKAFQRNRLVSFFLLIGSAAVAILSLVISSAFAAIV